MTMKTTIQGFSNDFINQWEAKNIKMGFSLRFPQLHEFVSFIMNSLHKHQQNQFFQQDDIYQQLKVALYEELQSRIQLELHNPI